jgi:hypothetical protein
LPDPSRIGKTISRDAVERDEFGYHDSSHSTAPFALPSTNLRRCPRHDYQLVGVKLAKLSGKRAERLVRRS